MGVKPRVRQSRRRRPAVTFDQLEPRRLLATFTVVNANDAGPGSLREAIELANATPGADEIAFAIPGDGPHAIALAEPLPMIAGPVLIDGYTQPGSRPNESSTGFDADIRVILDGDSLGWGDGLTLAGTGSIVRGLAFHRFSDRGLHIAGNENRIEGNILGARSDAAGEGNHVGIAIFAGDRNVIGGTSPEARNLISGNQQAGVLLQSVQYGRFFFDHPEQNRIQGNLIGTDPAGDGPLGNAQHGIEAWWQGQTNLVGGAEPGAGNVIAFNGRSGVLGSPIVSRNAIYENGGLGMSRFWESEPSRLNPTAWGGNYPLLTEAAETSEGFRVRGILLADADTSYVLEFFADEGDPSGFGEGRYFLGDAEVTADAEGHAIIEVVLPSAPPPGTAVVATATLPGSWTSEFSPSPATLATFANLMVTASVDAEEVRSGDLVTFSATLRNNGPGPATGARLIAPLPFFSYFHENENDPSMIVSTSTSQGSVTINGENIIFEVGTLELGGVVQASFTVRVPPPPADVFLPVGPYRFETTFRASSEVFDLFDNNEARLEVVVDRTELSIDRTISTDQLAVGEHVTAEYRVTNQGPAPANAVTFNHAFLFIDGLELVSLVSDHGTVTPWNEVQIGTLAPGETATVTAVFRAVQPGAFDLHAWVNSPSSDWTISPPPATITVSKLPGTEVITMSLPDLPRRAPRRVALSIATELDPARAADIANYRLELIHPSGRARAIPLQSVNYDPSTWTVMLQTRRALPIGWTIRVTVLSGGLTTIDGVPLDGNDDFVPGGDFVGLISAGRTLRYREADGDRVALAMSHGLLELQRRPNGDALALRLVTTARRAALFGRVRPAGGDGFATLPLLTFTGPAEKVYDRLPEQFLRPPLP